MNARRFVLLVTGLVVAALAALFALAQWERANQIATLASALATVAAVGISVWAALPAARARVRVSNTGKAAAGPGGRATSGLDGPAAGLMVEIDLDHSGEAEASGGGDASSGIRLT